MDAIPSAPEAGQVAWKRWHESDVVDVGYAAFAVRTYLEQADLGRYLDRVSGEIDPDAACDIGAGYGRLSMVLADRFKTVVAFEREPAFCEQGRRLLPGVRFCQVSTLERLPTPSGSFDFVLTFTVLQHLIDPVLQNVAGEIKRIVSTPGFVLLCEETDKGHVDGDLSDPNGRCTIGRSVEDYAALFAPLKLIETSPRRIEPTYPRPAVGTYMLFRSA
jgi:SAM-dependent methyltransferase